MSRILQYVSEQLTELTQGITVMQEEEEDDEQSSLFSEEVSSDKREEEDDDSDSDSSSSEEDSNVKATGKVRSSRRSNIEALIKSAETLANIPAVKRADLLAKDVLRYAEKDGTIVIFAEENTPFVKFARLLEDITLERCIQNLDDWQDAERSGILSILNKPAEEDHVSSGDEENGNEPILPTTRGLPPGPAEMVQNMRQRPSQGMNGYSSDHQSSPSSPLESPPPMYPVQNGLSSSLPLPPPLPPRNRKRKEKNSASQRWRVVQGMDVWRLFKCFSSLHGMDAMLCRLVRKVSETEPTLPIGSIFSTFRMNKRYSETLEHSTRVDAAIDKASVLCEEFARTLNEDDDVPLESLARSARELQKELKSLKSQGNILIDNWAHDVHMTRQ